MSNYRCALILTTIVMVMFTKLPSAEAVGETYDLSIAPTTMQETDSTGTRLTLAVSNATSLQTYAFSWTVDDPSGVNGTAFNSTLATSNFFSLSVMYPRDFPGLSLNHVGRYSATVTQTAPSVQTVANGEFEVVLTDRPTYNRTFTMSIAAAGYSPNDNVTINISTIDGPAPGFPKWQWASNTGTVSSTWLVPPDMPLGNSTLILSGASTPPKSPPDMQKFTVFPTSVAVPQLTIPRDSLQRSEAVEVEFDATYLSGVQVRTGSATVRLVEGGGTTTHNFLATFNSALGRFYAKYRIPLSAELGTWISLVEVQSLDDGFGNIGPINSPVRSFSVRSANLAVSIELSDLSYRLGDIMAIYATATSPEGSIFADGTVLAWLSSSDGRRIGGPIGMLFDAGQGRWLGSHEITTADPSGVWTVKVNATDPYGNYGERTFASVVSVPSTTNEPSIFDYWFIFPLVGATVGSAFFVLRRKGFFRGTVVLDVQAIKEESSRIKSQQFFRSIQSQLEKEKERLQGREDG